jgi:hypothetical protein
MSDYAAGAAYSLRNRVAPVAPIALGHRCRAAHEGTARVWAVVTRLAYPKHGTYKRNIRPLGAMNRASAPPPPPVNFPPLPQKSTGCCKFTTPEH